MRAEQWLDVVGYEGLYEVSDRGRVWSITRQLMRKPNRTGSKHRGTYSLSLSRNNVGMTRIVGRLVLEAFVGPCPEGQECCHFDDDPENNFLGNLRWDTRSANQFDRVQNGRHHQVKKTQCPSGHRYTKINTRIYQHNGATHRICIKCARKRSHDFYHNRKVAA